MRALGNFNFAGKGRPPKRGKKRTIPTDYSFLDDGRPYKVSKKDFDARLENIRRYVYQKGKNEGRKVRVNVLKDGTMVIQMEKKDQNV